MLFELSAYEQTCNLQDTEIAVVILTYTHIKRDLTLGCRWDGAYPTHMGAKEYVCVCVSERVHMCVLRCRLTVEVRIASFDPAPLPLKLSLVLVLGNCLCALENRLTAGQREIWLLWGCSSKAQKTLFSFKLCFFIDQLWHCFALNFYIKINKLVQLK